MLSVIINMHLAVKLALDRLFLAVCVGNGVGLCGGVIADLLGPSA